MRNLLRILLEHLIFLYANNIWMVVAGVVTNVYIFTRPECVILIFMIDDDELMSLLISSVV